MKQVTKKTCFHGLSRRWRLHGRCQRTHSAARTDGACKPIIDATQLRVNSRVWAVNGDACCDSGTQRNRREKKQQFAASQTNAIDEPRINEQTKQTVFNALDCNSLFDIGGAELLERLKERWVIAHDHLHVVFKRFSHDCEEGFCFICKNDVARNSCSPLDVKSLVNKTFETFFAFVGSINRPTLS